MSPRAPLRDHVELVASLAITLLVIVGAATCYGVARGEPAEPAADTPVTALRAGEAAPYAGILVPAETLRALLQAQDERDHERELRKLDAQQATADIDECRAISDARERARSQCEASRVPPACRCECAWGGWPWVSGVAGAAVGFGVGWAVTR